MNQDDSISDVRFLNQQGNVLEALYKANQLDPYDPAVILEKARSKLHMGHYNAPSTDLISILQTPNQNWDYAYRACKYLGFSAMMKGKLPDAVLYFVLGLQYAYQNKDDGQILRLKILLARAYIYSRKFSDANKVCAEIMKTISKSPDSPEWIHFNYCLSHYFLLRRDRASAQYNYQAKRLAMTHAQKSIAYKCAIEAKLIGNIFNIPYSANYENECRAYSVQSSSDLDFWVAGILDNDRSSHNFLIRELVTDPT